MYQVGYVYILTNKSNSVLYVGVTTDLVKRSYQHRRKYLKGFTERYNLYKLVYYEMYDKAEEAEIREKTIKGWLRKKKLALVESKNPEWKDMYDGIRGDPSLVRLRRTCSG